MEVCFSDLKEKEIVNVFDGKKLGRIIDILFDSSTGSVRGIVVPGDKKLFRKNDDIFVPLEKLKKIGDDVILVSLQASSRTYPYEETGRQGKSKPYMQNYGMANSNNYARGTGQQNVGMQNLQKNMGSSYVRFRPLSEKKYK